MDHSKTAPSPGRLAATVAALERKLDQGPHLDLRPPPAVLDLLAEPALPVVAAKPSAAASGREGTP